MRDTNERIAHYAATLGDATTAELMRRVETAVAKRTRATRLDADAVYAESLADAMTAVADGRLTVRHAVASAVRARVADAWRAAGDDTMTSLSLDAATGDDNTLTMIDNLDAIGGARWSHYDETAGIYRGVSRAPVPTDCLRPNMPSPEEIADAARDLLATPYRRALDACLAANVAAESQRLARIAEARAIAATAKRDAIAATARGQHKRAQQARQCTRDATQYATKLRQVTRAEDGAVARADAVENTYRPRAAEVTQALGLRSTGDNRAATGQALTLANTAYWEARAAIVGAAIAEHLAEWDAIAERSRAVFALAEPDAIRRHYAETPDARTDSHGRAVYRAEWSDDAIARAAELIAADGDRAMTTDQLVSCWGRIRPGTEYAALRQADATRPVTTRYAARMRDSLATVTAPVS